MASERVVCYLCREERRHIRIGLWLCRRHWRLIVELARLAKERRLLLTGEPDLVELTYRITRLGA
ncbi:MAG: hypothetical protein AB1762_14205 [Gemmatimonadota bacterium]